MDPPVSASMALTLQACTIIGAFYVGIGDPNSSPHDCQTSPYISYILSYNYTFRNLWCILMYMNNIVNLFGIINVIVVINNFLTLKFHILQLSI